MRVLATVFLSLAGLAAVAAEPPATEQPAALQRWGILATEEVRATGIADLLGAALAADESLVLVERELLDRAMKELDVSTFLGAGSTAARLQLGKTLAAEGLILLSVDKRPEGQALRLDLCDCRYGARLRSEWLRHEAADREVAVKRCAALLDEVRRQYRAGVRRIVCVPDFVSQNLKNTYASMQAACAQLLQERLIRVPGVAVVEIDEAEAIGRELQLGGTELRDAPAMMTVKGSFRVVDAADKATNLVNLHLDLFDGKERREVTRDGIPMRDLAAVLTGELATEILQAVDEAAPGLTQRHIADMLAQRAQTFASLGYFDRAASLREAVLMIDPDAAEQRIRLMAERTEPHYPRGYRQRNAPVQQYDVFIEGWQDANLRDRRIPFFMAHTEALIQRNQVNPREAVYLLEICRREAYADMEMVIACFGLRYQESCRVADDRIKTAEAFFWRMAPLVLKLDRGHAEGRNRNQMFLPFQQRPLDERPGADPMPPAEQDALATYELVLQCLKLGVVGVTRRPQPPINGYPQADARDLHFNDAGRLAKVAGILESLAPEDLRPHPEMLLLLSDAVRPLGQWLYDDPRFSAADARTFLENLAASRRPGVAYCGRFGLASLDASTLDAPQTAKRVTEIDWLVEQYPRVAITAATPKGSQLRKPQEQCLKHLKTLRDACMKRITAAPATVSQPLSSLEKDFRTAPEDILRLAKNPRVVAARVNLQLPYEPRFWLNCGDQFDVIGSPLQVHILRKSGELVELIDARRLKEPRRGIGDTVRWDGRYLWLVVGNSLRVFDAECRPIGQLDPSEELPEYDSKWLHAFAPGKAIMACQRWDDTHQHERGCWFAFIEVKDEGPGKGRLQARVIHEATQLSLEATGDTVDDPRQGFGIDWVSEFSFAETEGKRLLFVGRRFLHGTHPKRPARPLAIDLETLEVGVFPHAFPIFGSHGVQTRRFLPHGVVVIQALDGPPQIDVWKAPRSAAQPWKTKRVPFNPDAAVLHQGLLYSRQSRSRFDPGTLEVEEFVPKGEFIPLRELDGIFQSNVGRSALFGMVFWGKERDWDPAVDWATQVARAKQAPPPPPPPPVRPGFGVWRMHVDDPHAPPPDYSDHAVVIPEAFRDKHYRAMLRLWAAGAKLSVHSCPGETDLRIHPGWIGDRDDAAAVADLHNIFQFVAIGVARESIAAALRGLEDEGDVKCMVLSATPATNADFQVVGQMRKMEYLTVCNTEIDDEGLRVVGKLEGLISLRLRDETGKRLTAAGLAHLRNLPQLQWLILEGPGFGDEAVKALTGDMLPRLHSLTLTGCEVRTDLLRELKRQRPKISTYLHELY